MFLLPDQVYGEESSRLVVSSVPTVSAAAYKGGSYNHHEETSSGCEEDEPEPVEPDGYGQEMNRLLRNLETWQMNESGLHYSAEFLAKISHKFEMKRHHLKDEALREEVWIDLPPPVVLGQTEILSSNGLVKKASHPKKSSTSHNRNAQSLSGKNLGNRAAQLNWNRARKTTLFSAQPEGCAIRLMISFNVHCQPPFSYSHITVLMLVMFLKLTFFFIMKM